MFYKSILIGLFFFSVMLFSSCGGNLGGSPEQTKLIKEISELSLEVYQNEKPIDIKKGEELLQKLTSYTNSYRSDSISATYLLDAAQLAASLGKYQKAIDLLLNYAEHPKATKLDYATYLVGYEYDAHLKQPVNAERYYRATIERYPDSEWAKTANQSLQWLGLTDEELIHKLEEKNNAINAQ